MCMVAVSKGINFEFDLKPVRQREKTLGEILDDVPADSDLWNPCHYLDKKAVSDKKAGKGFAMQLVDEHSTKIGVVGKSYAKWRSTEALVANHPSDPKLKRQLTVDELSKAKTIDKNLVKGMSRTRQIEMNGNPQLLLEVTVVNWKLKHIVKKQTQKLKI